MIKLSDHQQALAEKDREIAYLQECRTSAAAMDAQRTIEYQQLMEKAVRFAEGVWQFIPRKDARQGREAYEFLHSPEVQAFLKEHQS